VIGVKRKLLDILACPICKHYPLDLYVFEEKEEIAEGLMTCSNCGRWYPIIDEIPHMLPDELRDGRDDIPFIQKWRAQFPEKTFREGKPFNEKNLTTR
jgi:uncharacterized protein YbaR (Trm112 family)